MSKKRPPLDFETAMRARELPCPYCGKGLVWHEATECLDRWAERLILGAHEDDAPLEYSRGVGFGEHTHLLVEAVYKKWRGEVSVSQHQSGSGVCWSASFTQWFYGDTEPYWSVLVEGYRTRQWGKSRWGSHSTMWIKTPRLAVTIAAITAAILNLGLVPEEKPSHMCRTCRHMNYPTSRLCEYCMNDPDEAPPPIPEGANVLTPEILERAFLRLKYKD
jgi:hypothetical protein